jgi:DNA-binding LacI/PurR family transcriptional regulator
VSRNSSDEVEPNVPEEASRSRAPSIRDVAGLAGVSYQTVSRVLNNHPSIRDTTRARVLQVMEELQYRPSRAARTLSTSRSRTIGVLAASAGLHYGPASSISAVEDAARAAGYYVTVAHLATVDEASISDGLDHLMTQDVEGIVVVAPQVRVFDAISSLSISVPFVTMQSAGLVRDHSLSVDQIAGAKLATRHLIELGHRRILHVAGPQDWVEAQARLHGFQAAMSEAGLQSRAPILGDWTAQFGYAVGRELVVEPDFTAIFASNDQMALGLLHAFAEAGLSVPGEISVVGFDDIPEAAHFWPPLTTVWQDFAELGRRCVRLLLAEIGDELGSYDRDVAPELIVRASTAPPG